MVKIGKSCWTGTQIIAYLLFRAGALSGDWWRLSWADEDGEGRKSFPARCQVALLLLLCVTRYYNRQSCAIRQHQRLENVSNLFPVIHIYACDNGCAKQIS